MSVPTPSAPSNRGDHTLPALIRSAPLPTPRRRRPIGLLASLGGVVVLIAATIALQLLSNVGYDEALTAHQAAVDDMALIEASLGDDASELESTTAIADQLVQNDTGVLADPAAKEILAAGVSVAASTAATASDLLDEAVPAAGPKPIVFWELFAATDAVHDLAAQIHHRAAELTDMAPDVASASEELTTTGLAFLATASAAAPAFEGAHLSAGNDAVIALRDAATALDLAASLDDAAVADFTALQEAAANVVASEQSELAQKAGPLRDARLDVEAFARSLAPGVLLEFDWAPIVNGAGDNGSMGGLTRWWWDEPDRAVIQLSDSVAEQWPAERSRALVAHEVGHAISVKCEDMYDSSTQDSIEKWATAWAISMGFTDDANGVWAYGYPPQSYIDAAEGCR